MDPVALQTELTQLVEKLDHKPGETIKLEKNVNTYARIIEICEKLKAMGVQAKGGNKTRRNRRQRHTRRH